MKITDTRTEKIIQQQNTSLTRYAALLSVKEESLHKLQADVQIKDRIIEDNDKRLQDLIAYNEGLKLSLRKEADSLTAMQLKKESLDIKLATLLVEKRAVPSDSEQSEWKMAKARLDQLNERMEADLAAVADTKKAWDDRVLELRKESRRT